MRLAATLAGTACWLAAAAAAQHQQQAAEAVAAARAAAAKGAVHEAADAWLRACELAPDDPQWLEPAVAALVTASRHNDALDLLDAARKRFPTRAALATLLAKTYLLKGEAQVLAGRPDQHTASNLDEAERAAREALALDQDDRDAHLILGQVLYLTGRGDETLAQADAVIARFPDHPGGYLLRARVMVDRYAEGRQQLNSGGVRGAEADALVKALEVCRKDALAQIERAAQADPDRAFPHKLRGDLLAWQGDMAMALASYGRALALDPTTKVDHTWLQGATTAEQRAAFYRDARDAYSRRGDADPARAATLSWHLGYAELERKRWAEAYDAFVAAVRGNPAYLNSLYYAAMAAWWQGRHDDAEAGAAAYAQRDPVAFADLVRGLAESEQTLATLSFLAARAYRSGRLAPSLALNHVLALVHDDAESWNNYAFLCREVGAAAESLRGYERALALEPDSPQLLNDCAVVLHYHLGGKAEVARARTMYERAVQLAEARLAGGGLDAAAKARVQKALSDARANLARMAGAGGGR